MTMGECVVLLVRLSHAHWPRLGKKEYRLVNDQRHLYYKGVNLRLIYWEVEKLRATSA